MTTGQGQRSFIIGIGITGNIDQDDVERLASALVDHVHSHHVYSLYGEDGVRADGSFSIHNGTIEEACAEADKADHPTNIRELLQVAFDSGINVGAEYGHRLSQDVQKAGFAAMVKALEEVGQLEPAPEPLQPGEPDPRD